MRDRLSKTQLTLLVLGVTVGLAAVFMIPARQPKLETENWLVNLYRTVVLLEREFGDNLETLTSERKLQWGDGLTLSQKVRILCEIRGLDVTAWRSGDAWGNQPLFRFVSSTNADGHNGELDSILSRLRIWSAGPNRKDEDGKGDDILAPSYWVNGLSGMR